MQTNFNHKKMNKQIDSEVLIEKISQSKYINIVSYVAVIHFIKDLQSLPTPINKNESVIFAEWIDSRYNKESDDEYLLKDDYKIPYKDEDHQTKKIKELYQIFKHE